ncbi:hypothetical protein C8R45DRAFT_1124591 [Mycena sanguinolenta]|nr:hypothetical protein C8R45DRAFT_1124591 [Mycena sanguinolenta]
MSHFINGPVTYSAEGFLAKNLDALNPDFDCQPVKPMRASSTRRKTALKRTLTSGTNPNAKGGASTGTVVGEFRNALDTLFGTLSETNTWHLFCVNPNEAQLPNQLEGRSVKGQRG